MGNTGFALLLPCVLIGAIDLSQRTHSEIAAALIRVLLAVGLAGMLRHLCSALNDLPCCCNTLKEQSAMFQVGDKIPVYIYKNLDFRLPEDAAKPIIMVGPGTGLAPFRWVVSLGRK